MAALFSGLLYVRFLSTHSRDFLRGLKKENRKRISIALQTYGILILLIVIFNFFTPLRELFAPYAFSLQFPELSTTYGFSTPAEMSKKINLLLHPGTVLAISAMASYVFLKKKAYLKGNELTGIISDTFKRSLNSSAAIFSLVGVAVVMNHAQMTNILAEGLSRVFKQDVYPLVAPFIGALGAFITGSNNNSNVLFGSLQMQTANLLSLSTTLILAAQTTGGSIGSIAAPAKVIIGCSTVGLSGQEGKVIGRVILYASILILIAGVITLIFSRIS
jgi:lactate permease